MTMENPPFEDVFPIEKWRFSNVMLVFRGVYTTNYMRIVKNQYQDPYTLNQSEEFLMEFLPCQRFQEKFHENF